MAKIKYPTEVTLKKYGLTRFDYRMLFESQNGHCPICQNPLIKRTNIDHYHVKKWKKMPPERRKLYVRGILCWTCNKLIVGRGVTLARLKAASEYIERFETRNETNPV